MTIFKDIVDGKIPCEKVFENERVIAFKDIAPQAPVHILIIPKKEIPDIQSVVGEDIHLVGEIIKVAQSLAKEFGIEEGYRLVTNNGSLGGQAVFHLHFHLLGGKQLSNQLA
ncbi:MAG: Purine nucleoside phosphoramidase [Chlamydiae bacterium]|nr:Purine nucleoside phosphoramidase [Chlamydiota bacterium]